LTLKKHRSILAAFILVTFVLVVRWDSSVASEHQPNVLLRIEIADEAQLERFAALKIPVYAHLWNESGEPYLLVGPNREQQIQIEREGFSARVLDSNPQGAYYYLVFKPYPDFQFGMPSGIVTLDVTPDHVLIRTSPADVEELAKSGFEISRLWLEPLVLPTYNAELEKLSAVTYDAAIQTMIDQVNSTTAYNYVGNLSGAWQIRVNGNPYTLSTRYSYAEIPIKKATRFVYEHLTGLGLYTYYDHYSLYGVELRSVIAEQPGVTDPDCIVLMVGHLDSISPDPYNNAPGADDNASGSAGVLIGADILHQYQFACTIRYILFTGEEQGYWGSKAYADDVYGAGENVVAVVNLDMLGYNGDQAKVIELHTRPGNAGDSSIATLFKGVIQTYGINLTTQILEDGLSFSDHSPFWNKGYSAILCIEDWYGDHTPYYHSTSDRLNTLDLSYLRNYIKAAVGSVAHLAIPIEPTPEPVVTFYFPLLFNSE
jgi:hypothetical protein